jgi:deoxyinosine 3'endonuclease (endonuclease V)
MSDIDQKKTEWLKIEDELRQKQQQLIEVNNKNDKTEIIEHPFWIGGADLSFLQNDESKAVCVYVILLYNDKDDQVEPETVYKDVKIVNLG